MAYPIEKIRADFPVLNQKVSGRPIIYLDSACMSLKPRQVTEAVVKYHDEHTACAGRSMHRFAAITTDKVNMARKAVAKFINAKYDEEIIFTNNTTESVNLLANTLIQKGDYVLTSDKEHNSNLIPWLKLKKEGKIRHEVFKFGDIEDMKRKINGAKLLSIVHVSNLDGMENPIAEMIKMAHKEGCLVHIDAAQSIPHMDIDVRKLDADFLSFSGHKMLAPTGTGVLYGKKAILEKLPAFMVGGETVKNSTYDDYELEDIPNRFEYGLRNYSGIIGLGEACTYLKKIGLKNIHEHEIRLNKIVTERLGDKVHILGGQDPEKRGGIFSFTLDKVDVHQIALMLDSSSNIMTRSGMHCCHSWFNANKLKGSCRASFYLYNTEEEAKLFADEMEKVIKVLKR